MSHRHLQTHDAAALRGVGRWTGAARRRGVPEVEPQKAPEPDKQPADRPDDPRLEDDPTGPGKVDQHSVHRMRQPAARHRTDDVKTGCRWRRLECRRRLGWLAPRGHNARRSFICSSCLSLPPVNAAALPGRRPLPGGRHPLSPDRARSSTGPALRLDSHSSMLLQQIQIRSQARAAGRSEMPHDRANLSSPQYSSGVFARRTMLRHN